MMQLAGIAGVAMVAVGLWVWGLAAVWAESAQRVGFGAWAGRSMAVGLIALGQVVFAWWVVPHFFSRGERAAVEGRLERRFFEQVVTLAAVLTGLVAFIVAIALAGAARWI